MDRRAPEVLLEPSTTELEGEVVTFDGPLPVPAGTGRRRFRCPGDRVDLHCDPTLLLKIKLQIGGIRKDESGRADPEREHTPSLGGMNPFHDVVQVEHENVLTGSIRIPRLPAPGMDRIVMPTHDVEIVVRPH